MTYLSSAICGIAAAILLSACAGSGTAPGVSGSVNDGSRVSRLASSETNGAGNAVATAPSVQKIKPGEITGVSIEQLFSLNESEKVLLIDCRPGLFYHLGHIKDALNMPLKKYQAMIDTNKTHFNRALKEGKIIVFYCQNLNCPDAYLFAKAIAKEGYSTSVYKGGWEEWKASGL